MEVTNTSPTHEIHSGCPLYYGEDILNMKSLECACKSSKCNGTVSPTKIIWNYRPRIKDINEKSEIIPIYTNLCNNHKSKINKNTETYGWDLWDAADGLFSDVQDN